MQKYEFVYKYKHYEFDLRFSIPNSDYIWENLEQILHQHQIQLIDNQDDTNFSEDSIYDFISYLKKPNADILNKKNVYTFKSLNEKYKVKELDSQVDNFIQKHKLELIIYIIGEKKSIDDVDIEDIKIVVDRLFEFISDDDDKRILLSLPIPFIQRILRDYRIKYPDTEIDNERKIMNFFIEYFGLHGKPSSVLFEYINFEKVGSECMFKIMSNYPESFDFSCIPISVLKILCTSYTKRSPSQNINKIETKPINDQMRVESKPTTNDQIRNETKPLNDQIRIESKPTTNDQIINETKSINDQFLLASTNEFMPSTEKEFDGILKYLTSQTGGNIHKNGTIEITSNSIFNEKRHPKYLVNYNGTNCFYHSNNKPDCEICFDFKNRSVQLAYYSLKSHSSSEYCGHLKNWAIEVSNDKKNWIEIDRHTDDRSLNGPNFTKIFQINNLKKEFYRFIRLHQTGYSWNGKKSKRHIFYLRQIEFFGILRQFSQSSMNKHESTQSTSSINKYESIQLVPSIKNYICTKSSPSTNKYEFMSSKGKEFDGILKYLTNQTGGNIHDNGTIKITTNSSYNGVYHPKNLVDYIDNDKFYYSDNICSSQICFDFKNMSIMLSSYSIKSYFSGPNTGHLKNWVIEASNDKKNWIIIDRRTDDSSLNGSNITKEFFVNQPRNEFYRFIQLRQTGYCWFNSSTNYHIYFQSIEFFGKLVFIDFKDFFIELKEYSNQLQFNFTSFIEKLQILSNKEEARIKENEHQIIKAKILDSIKEYNSNLEELLNINDKNNKLLFINKCRKLNNLSHNEYLSQLVQNKNQYGLNEINCVTFKYVDQIDLQLAFKFDIKSPFVFKNDPESNDGTQNMFFRNDVYTYDELVQARLETYFNGFIEIHKDVCKISFNPYNIYDPKIDQLSSNFVNNKLEKTCLIFGNKYKLSDFIDALKNYVSSFNQLIKVFDNCSFDNQFFILDNLKKIRKLMDEVKSILNVHRSDDKEKELDEFQAVINQFLEIINLISSYTSKFLNYSKDEE